MTRLSLVLLLLIAGSIACGQPAPRLTDESARGAQEAVAARLDVICQRDGSTELINHDVRARTDGVHIQVDNRAGETTTLNGTGLDFSTGVTEQVARVSPGHLRIACWPGSMHTGSEPKRVAVQVHDPNGYWTAARLECPEGDMVMKVTRDFAADSVGMPGDPEDITRREVKGVEPADAIFTVGYPQAEYRTVAVERNEDVIALVSLSPAPRGGWLIGGYSACDSVRMRV